MITNMTRETAAALRAGAATETALLSHKPKYELTAIERGELAAAGISRLVGNSSKDELIASLLSLRGYDTSRLNEASHVLYHEGTPWPACEYCQPPAWIRCSGQPGCACDECSAPEPTGSRGPR